jgi:hypothetical protein
MMRYNEHTTDKRGEGARSNTPMKRVTRMRTVDVCKIDLTMRRRGPKTKLFRLVPEYTLIFSDQV